MGRRIGAWLGWLAAALLLYFFENNTGTRAVLVMTILVPLFFHGVRTDNGEPAGHLPAGTG